MKKNIIVANWKMNPDSPESAERLFNQIKKEVKKIQEIELVICPPFVYLQGLKEIQKKQKFIKLGAQNCFWEEKGAFTGEVSPIMLKKMGCEYVILGHSERREFLKEDDEMISKKIEKSLKENLKPILCIGEKEEQKENEETFNVLSEQIKNTIGRLKTYQLTNLIIAYEPIWAIGTGKNCQPNEAMTVLTFVKKELLKICPKKVAERIPILYGGSVNSKNAKEYIKVDFNGLLVGGASLRANEIIRIIKLTSEKII